MQQELKPFLKWVGGKRQLLPLIKNYLPRQYNYYYEPFVGAGALFLNLKPQRAVVNDLNSELINCYRTIKQQPKALITELQSHYNDKEHFYDVRAWDRCPEFKERSAVERAGRTIYLNKTCFNGLYRVNRKGQFNTPFGRYANPKIADDNLIMNLHQFLKRPGIQILNQDFERVLRTARRGDFVYVDPPYDPVSRSASFTAYQADGFGRNEQERLRNVIQELTRRGVYVMASNSATDYIRSIYKPFYQIRVGARRAINSRADRRGKVDELLILNYNPQSKQILSPHQEPALQHRELQLYI